MSSEQQRAQMTSSKLLQDAIRKSLQFGGVKDAPAVAFFLVRDLEENPDLCRDFGNDLKTIVIRRFIDAEAKRLRVLTSDV